jgi:hypothetical protein
MMLEFAPVEVVVIALLVVLVTEPVFVTEVFAPPSNMPCAKELIVPDCKIVKPVVVLAEELMPTPPVCRLVMEPEFTTLLLEPTSWIPWRPDNVTIILPALVTLLVPAPPT